MSDRELLAYIQRILSTCSEFKAGMVLRELQRILGAQGTPPEQMKLLENTLRDLHEAKQISSETGGRALTREDLRIAEQRAEQRRERERQMRDEGRC